jgi:flagellar biosynthesis/type III secretory pathway protein FliH
VSSSPHRIRFSAPLREVRLRNGRESLVSEQAAAARLEEKYRAGYEAGQKALREELLTQRNQLLEIQNTILRSIERTLPSFAASCEKELIRLALDAARRVVHNTPVNAEAIEAALREGLSEIQGTTEYQVRLNPEDLALLQSVQSAALPSASSKVTFLADETVPRAGCQIHTKHGSILLSRDRALEKLEEALL